MIAPRELRLLLQRPFQNTQVVIKLFKLQSSSMSVIYISAPFDMDGMGFLSPWHQFMKCRMVTLSLSRLLVSNQVLLTLKVQYPTLLFQHRVTIRSILIILTCQSPIRIRLFRLPALQMTHQVCMGFIFIDWVISRFLDIFAEIPRQTLCLMLPSVLADQSESFPLFMIYKHRQMISPKGKLQSFCNTFRTFSMDQLKNLCSLMSSCILRRAPVLSHKLRWLLVGFTRLFHSWYAVICCIWHTLLHIVIGIHVHALCTAIGRPGLRKTLDPNGLIMGCTFALLCHRHPTQTGRSATPFKFSMRPVSSSLLKKSVRLRFNFCQPHRTVVLVTLLLKDQLTISLVLSFPNFGSANRRTLLETLTYLSRLPNRMFRFRRLRPVHDGTDQWLLDLGQLFSESAEVETFDGEAFVYVQTWYIDHHRHTVCRRPRPVRLDSHSVAWIDDFRHTWRDLMDFDVFFSIHVVKPRPPQYRHHNYVCHIVIEQNRHVGQAAGILTALLSGYTQDGILQGAFQLQGSSENRTWLTFLKWSLSAQEDDVLHITTWNQCTQWLPLKSLRVSASACTLIRSTFNCPSGMRAWVILMTFRLCRNLSCLQMMFQDVSLKPGHLVDPLHLIPMLLLSNLDSQFLHSQNLFRIFLPSGNLMHLPGMMKRHRLKSPHGSWTIGTPILDVPMVVLSAYTKILLTVKPWFFRHGKTVWRLDFQQNFTLSHLSRLFLNRMSLPMSFWFRLRQTCLFPIS